MGWVKHFDANGGLGHKISHSLRNFNVIGWIGSGWVGSGNSIAIGSGWVCIIVGSVGLEF